MSVSQELNDYPMGQLIEGIFECIDQYESELNGLRTSAAMREAVRQGYFPGSSPPYGFTAKKVEVKPGMFRSILTLDESEAAVVRKLFQLYVAVIFETASPFDTPRFMEALISWTNAAFNNKADHSLLVIATFVVRFLAIHPFQDGNGRLSRALTTLLLLRAGYSYVPYSSLERIIEDSKNDYYKALRRAQTTLDMPLDNNESQLIDWITFFVRILKQQKDVLEHKIKREKLMTPLAPLSEKILALVREHGRITVRDAQTLTQANRNTIKEHLKSLVNAGHLQKRGQGRGTWYEKK